MDAISSGNESDAEPISMDMLEDICDGSQSHPSINSREACHNIHYIIKQGQVEWKEALLSTQNMGKVYTYYLRLLLMRFCKLYPFWVNLDQNFLTSF